jgi:uncharacterized membrane protein YqjE
MDTDDGQAGAPPGIIDSLKRMLATLVELLHTRVELFTTELQEEMHRVAMLLLWAVIAVFFGGLFVLMLSLTIVIAFWDSYRLLAASLMTLVFFGIVLTAVLTVRAKIRSHPRLLAESIEELKRDGEALGAHGRESR